MPSNRSAPPLNKLPKPRSLESSPCSHGGSFVRARSRKTTSCLLVFGYAPVQRCLDSFQEFLEPHEECLAAEIAPSVLL